MKDNLNTLYKMSAYMPCVCTCVCVHGYTQILIQRICGRQPKIQNQSDESRD